MVSDKDVERGVALVFAALKAAQARYDAEPSEDGEDGEEDVGWFDDVIGTLDMSAEELVKALLAQGWSMPDGGMSDD
jgi:hypothetical protein